MQLCRQTLLVYELPTGWQDLCLLRNADLSILDRKNILILFKDNKERQKTFLKFVNHGFYGIAWHKADEWLSYAWMKLPWTFGPPHLPRAIKKFPVHWIFYCRTREEYQGRGLYKASLVVLARFARKEDEKAQVYIDTSPDNISSRRAIKDVGFLPKGIITVWNLRLPKFNLVFGGFWDQEAPHPLFPTKECQIKDDLADKLSESTHA